MTREEVIRMAKEAGIITRGLPVGGVKALEAFADLVAAAEREACAQVVEAIPLPSDLIALTHLPTIERCAAAIRARIET
jgi:hypothetical protein